MLLGSRGEKIQTKVGQRGIRSFETKVDCSWYKSFQSLPDARLSGMDLYFAFDFPWTFVFFGTTGCGLRELIKNYICCNPTPLHIWDFCRLYPILINVSLIFQCHVEAKYLTIGTTTRRKQILKGNQPLPYFAQQSCMHCVTNIFWIMFSIRQFHLNLHKNCHFPWFQG